MVCNSGRMIFDHPIYTGYLTVISAFFEGRILPLISSTHPISATTGYRLLKTDMNIRRLVYFVKCTRADTHTTTCHAYAHTSYIAHFLFPLVVKRIASDILSFNQEREFIKKMFVNTATHPHNPTNRRRCNALI